MPIATLRENNTAPLVPNANTVLRGLGSSYQYGSLLGTDFQSGQIPVKIAQPSLSGVGGVLMTSIPQTFSSLLIAVSGRTNVAAIVDNVYIEVGGSVGSVDSGNNYQYQYLYGNGASSSGIETFATSVIHAGYLPGATATASLSSSVLIWIPNYTSSTFHKNFICSASSWWTAGTAGAHGNYFIAGLWKSTAPIITVYALAGSGGVYQTGSQITLWGIP